MCSTTSERIARIGAAIDELAAESGHSRPGGHGDQADQADDISGRLAQLWAMVAELDPELARRLPRYLA
jgi:hypothetical protein